jgi:hypothetical protein
MNKNTQALHEATEALVSLWRKDIIKGTMSTTMHCALKECLAAILLAE